MDPTPLEQRLQHQRMQWDMAQRLSSSPGPSHLLRPSHSRFLSPTRWIENTHSPSGHLSISYIPDQDTPSFRDLSDSERSIRSRSPLREDVAGTPGAPGDQAPVGDPSRGSSPTHPTTVVSPTSPIPGPSCNCGALVLSSTPIDPSNSRNIHMDGGPLDPRFHDDDHGPDVDIFAMDVEKRGGESLPTPTRYDVIMRQLSQALNDRESKLIGRPQGEWSTIQTYSVPCLLYTSPSPRD